MSKLPSKPFSDPKLNGNLKDVTSATLVVQTYATMILQQTDIKLDALPKLPAHQNAGRRHATNWNKIYLPAMSGAIADVIDYSNQFMTFHDQLVQYANDKCSKKLVEGLQILLDAVEAKYRSTEDVVDKLTTFHQNLTGDYKNFQQDYNDALVKIQGDHGEIKALGDELDGIQKAMNKDIGLMAGGAVTIVSGIISIACGTILEIFSGGTSTVLIGCGILAVVGGVTMETLGAIDYSKEIKKQKQVNEKLQEEKQQMTALKHVNGQLESIKDGVLQAITAAETLMTSWNSLAADLKTVIDAIDRADHLIDSDYLVAELNTAKSNWQVALDKAKQLQPTGEVRVEIYKDLLEAFKKMKPQG